MKFLILVSVLFSVVLSTHAQAQSQSQIRAKVLNCAAWSPPILYTFYGVVETSVSVSGPGFMEDFKDIDDVRWVPVDSGYFKPNSKDKNFLSITLGTDTDNYSFSIDIPANTDLKTSGAFKGVLHRTDSSGKTLDLVSDCEFQ